jgi:hypothetical protein
MRALVAEAGFEGIRIVTLAPDSRAKGPGLFAATAVKGKEKGTEREHQ